MSDLARAINRHVGRPWCAAGFDCWEFVRAAYAEAYGVILPQLPGVDGADPRAAATATAHLRAAGDWHLVNVPSDGDAITMGTRSRPHHVGIWCGGRIAHCDQSSGVVVVPLHRLTGVGWQGFHTFRHISQQVAP